MKRLLALAACLALSACSATDVGPEEPGAHKVTYTVTGNDGAFVAYNDGADGIEKATARKLPWKRTVDSPGNVVEAYAVSASNISTEPVRLKCTLEYDGKVVSTDTGSTVACRYTP